MSELGINYREDIFRPVRTKRAFEEISTEIKRLIFEGILKPGDRLPNENELARQFSVSRQTIREALRILELTGVIKMQKGGAGGPLIVDTILNAINSLYVDVFQMKKITHEELVAARIKIEKMVMDEVINRADNADIERLEENVARTKQLLEKNMVAFQENIEFHKLLARASKNHVFLIVMESLTTVVAYFRSQRGLHVDISRQAVADHEEIIQAIKRRDRENASALLEKHLAFVDAMIGGSRINAGRKRTGSPRK